jgi:predicted Abi (CAAX) family protease
LHYSFQWYFSREKPHLGFKFPYPYSALSPSSFITRNQAISCALAPALILTLILSIPALFTFLLFRVLLLAWASIELASCYNDLYFTYRLLKHPSNCLLKNVDLRNVLFKPKT